ncbi:MAG TPA: amidohydrolase family protein [Candidatus Tectomicrobia bacterium]|nr:amidohydrolase family protein [Candidatus Tectomicrobia bacterium]
MSTYTLISSDSHIIEPADLWETRLDRQFRERGPQLVREGDTDQWYADGVKFGNIGTNQQAGLRFEAPEQLTAAGSMNTIPLGGVDPHAHVKDMDRDSVAGGVLYPSQGLTIYRVPDSQLLSAILRAYNDWLADFCKPCPNRLKGIAMLNVDDPDDAASELQRAAKMGLAGGMIPLRPMEHRYDHPKYEPLWAAAQDLGMPLSLHVGTYRWQPGMDPNAMGQDIVEFTNRDHDVRTPIAAMIYAGVFERYPRLRVGAVEFEVSWAPYFLARLDNVYTERAVGRKLARFKDDMLPSDFFRRNVFISFQEDDLGIRLRSVIGVENLMWGSDYPHAESTFPKSRQIVERMLKDVPDEQRVMIAGGNAARLYHFN